MITLQTSNRPLVASQASRLGDLVLDLAVPALAALLTLGIFLLAMG